MNQDEAHLSQKPQTQDLGNKRVSCLKPSTVRFLKRIQAYKAYEARPDLDGTFSFFSHFIYLSEPSFPSCHGISLVLRGLDTVALRALVGHRAFTGEHTHIHTNMGATSGAWSSHIWQMFSLFSLTRVWSESKREGKERAGRGQRVTRTYTGPDLGRLFLKQFN